MRLQLLTKKKRRKDQQQHQLQHVNAFEVQITWQSGELTATTKESGSGGMERAGRGGYRMGWWFGN